MNREEYIGILETNNAELKKENKQLRDKLSEIKVELKFQRKNGITSKCLCSKHNRSVDV